MSTSNLKHSDHTMCPVDTDAPTFLFLLGVKNSCVSTNMLKKSWSAGRKFFFSFSILFSPEKKRVGPVSL